MYFLTVFKNFIYKKEKRLPKTEQVRKKWTMEKKHPLDVEYTSGGIFNAKKLPTHK